MLEFRISARASTSNEKYHFVLAIFPSTFTEFLEIKYIYMKLATNTSFNGDLLLIDK